MTKYRVTQRIDGTEKNGYCGFVDEDVFPFAGGAYGGGSYTFEFSVMTAEEIVDAMIDKSLSRDADIEKIEDPEPEGDTP